MKLFNILGSVPNYEKLLILNELLNFYCAAGQDRTGRDNGRNATGRGGMGQDRAESWPSAKYESFLFTIEIGRDWTGQDRTGRGGAEQNTTGRDRIGRDRARWDRTGQDETGRDRIGWHGTGQDGTGQDGN